jgi:hypothetical protein
MMDLRAGLEAAKKTGESVSHVLLQELALSALTL